jgi:hypothetical protein
VKNLLPVTFCVLMLACLSVRAQETLTLYYDKDGKGLDTKKKAAFYRIVTFDANNKPIGTIKDYFPNGQLQMTAEAAYIDKLDNRKSIWNGHMVEYNDKGTIIFDYNYDDEGHPNGIQTGYNADGIKIFEAEYSHGNPTKDYYLLYDKTGAPVKYSYLNHQPIKLSTIDKIIVPIAEKKEIYRDGQAVQYYNVEGITVAVRASREKLYGDYYEIYITIENGTPQQFDFDPSTITAAYVKNNKPFDGEVLTYDYYIKKVNRKQKWSAAFNAFAQSEAANQAGYSASSTYATAQGTSNNGTVVTASGQSTTAAYNGANQYAATQNAQNNINNYNNSQYSIKQSIAQGYLKMNTVMPNSRLIGFVNVKYEKADGILINIPVNGKVYQYSYGIKN